MNIIMLTGQYYIFLLWCSIRYHDANRWTRMHTYTSFVLSFRSVLGEYRAVPAHTQHTDTHTNRLHGRLEIGEMNESVSGLADAAKNIFALVSKYILPRLCRHPVCVCVRERVQMCVCYLPPNFMPMNARRDETPTLSALPYVSYL